MKGVAAVLLLLLVGCRESAVESPTGTSFLKIRNSRSEVIKQAMRGACSSDSTTTRALMSATARIDPGAVLLVEVEPKPVCHDLRFLNEEGSVVDSRPQVQVDAADTLIITLVPVATPAGS